MSGVEEIRMMLGGATGAIYLYAGGSKLLNLEETRQYFRMIPYVRRATARIAAAVLPPVEVVTGVCLVGGTRWARPAGIGLALVFIAVTITVLRKRLRLPCACFGPASNRTFSSRTVLFNALLIAGVVCSQAATDLPAVVLASTTGVTLLMLVFGFIALFENQKSIGALRALRIL